MTSLTSIGDSLVFKHANIATYYDGDKLFRQGEKGGSLYIIKEGEVEISVQSEKTGRSTVVAVKGKNDVLGLLSFLDGEERNATGIARQKVVCEIIDKKQRVELLKEIPKWFTALVKDISKSLKNLTREYGDIESDYHAMLVKNNTIF